MEVKANAMDYRKHQGADIIHEFVQAMKFLSYDEETFEIEKYNPARSGYLQLVDLKRKGREPVTVMVENRFDYQGDGVTLNGYEKVRREQIERACQLEDRQIMKIKYKRLAALFKGSTSNEEYRKFVLDEIN